MVAAKVLSLKLIPYPKAMLSSNPMPAIRLMPSCKLIFTNFAKTPLLLNLYMSTWRPAPLGCLARGPCRSSTQFYVLHQFCTLLASWLYTKAVHLPPGSRFPLSRPILSLKSNWDLKALMIRIPIPKQPNSVPHLISCLKLILSFNLIPQTNASQMGGQWMLPMDCARITIPPLWLDGHQEVPGYLHISLLSVLMCSL